MEGGHAWRSLFENWPQAIPREGLLVTTFNEQIAFVDFLVSGGLLLVERDRPDSFGARKVIVAYEAISAVKLASTKEMAEFQSMGFEAPF